MREVHTIGLRTSAGWKPAIAFIREWKHKGAATPLFPSVEFAGPDRKPTPAFIKAWKGAFATLDPLPPGVVMLKEDGHPTDDFVRLFNGAGI